MLKDIYPGPGDGGPNFLTPLGDYIVFSAADANGDELWITDGTEAGTHPIIDLAPGAESSVPQNLMVHGDEIIFTAYKPGTGIELWQTDGTANGTILLADINPDGNSHPLEFVTMGDILYFTAYHPNSGREIWALNMETLSVTPLGSAELSVYPNPTVESLTIDLSELKDEKTNVQVWSLNGQKIIERQFNGNNLLTLNVSGLAPSAYLLRVENGNKVFSQAFIKQ
jgi:ELWxxDGT repeat protein